jgi:general secretion pathway protein A
MLSMIARFCQQNPEAALIVRGYTDRSGVRAYNLKLSEFRADMVKTYLVGKGANADSITTVGVGPDVDGPGGTTVPYDGKRRKVVIEIITPVE